MKDVWLAAGLIFGLYALMQFIGSLLERRPSIFWGLALLVFGGMLARGWAQQEAGFGPAGIPDAVIRALGVLFN